MCYAEAMGARSALLMGLGIVAAGVLSCGGGGCAGRKTTQKMIQEGSTFTSMETGIAVTIPAGWKEAAHRQPPEDEKEYILVVENDAGGRISLDVPPMPAFALIIPMGRVVSGYQDDLRERFGDVKTEENAERKVPDATARLVRSTWSKDGKSYSQTALLMVHNRRVYILRGDNDAASDKQTAEAFEAVAGSIRWIGK